MGTLEAVFDAGAAYRLTRLLTKDGILNGPRARLIAWSYGETHLPRGDHAQVRLQEVAWHRQVMDDDAPPKLAELVTCRWCVGMYVAAAVVAARRVAPGVWDPIARALTASAAAALLAGLEQS